MVNELFEPRSVHLPRWAKPFAMRARYKSARGGRGSSKTWTAAHILVAEAAARPLTVVEFVLACCREFQSSIRVSAKPALETAIYRMGLSKRFAIYDQQIKGVNGSLFFFRGMERNREEIRGWENVDRVWVEEAQRMSEATARVLIPTIRKPGSELIFTWNPASRSDWVWRRFVLNARPNDVSLLINWRDNQWFPDEAEEERRADQKDNPDLYNHIWEGEPDDEGMDRDVLPYKMLQTCVQAFKDYSMHNFSGQREVGLDVADTGANWNALTMREGPVIRHVEKWRAPVAGVTARRGDMYARQCGAHRLYYDAGGVGAGVRSYFAEMPNRTYAVRPELFGGKIKGEKTVYSYRLTNGEFFAHRNAQLGWAVKLRGQNTQRLVRGEAVDPARCLFIDPDIPRLDEYLTQLSQPKWRENEVTGKTELLKRDEEEASPDLYDSTVLSFARDSENGLRAR